MGLLLAFAFLAGVVTILSPCILPVLPLVLSGGLGSGRAQPWGVVAGFTLSFAALTLSLSALVRTLGLDPGVLRGAAALVILLFGLVLAVPFLKDRFLAGASALVSRWAPSGGPPRRPGRGFWSGLVLGASLGAVWTPCVGPIMASVITLALSQTVTASSLLLTLAYTLGTALPLGALVVGGRRLLDRFPALGRRSAGLQRAFGVLMMVTGLALFTGADRAFSTWVLGAFPGYGAGLTALENQAPVRAELDRLKPTSPGPTVPSPDAPGTPDVLSLGQGAWIGSPPLTLGGLRGRVVLVDFWTYSCINCLRTLPTLRAWADRYGPQGLVLVGVHSPEFAFEASEANLRRAVADLGVTWPVVQDNGFGIWNAYQNQFWPAHYLYDRQGRLLEAHFGEGGEAQTEALIAGALGSPLAAPGVPSSPTSSPSAPSSSASAPPQTPETYLGAGRGQRFASPEDVALGSLRTYSAPASLEADRWAFAGPWTIASEASRSEAGSALVLRFQGARVHLVLGRDPSRPPGPAPRLKLWVDGVERPGPVVDGDRMYTLVDDPGRPGGLLRIEFDAPVLVYAFTFG